MPYISGLFTATFTPPGGTATNVGDTEVGWEVTESFFKDDIRASIGGLAPISGTAAGSSVIVRATMVEYDVLYNNFGGVGSAQKSPFWGLAGQGQPLLNVGLNIVNSLAGLLILTPVAGSPWATVMAGKTLNVYKAVNISDVSTLFSYRASKGPLTFQAYPDPANNYMAYNWV